MELAIVFSLIGLIITVIGAAFAMARTITAMEIRMMAHVAEAVASTATASDARDRRLHARIDLVDTKVNANTTHIATMRRLCDERHHRKTPITEAHHNHG
jgi:hypothetical protein